MKIFLHIGDARTGSSTLQSALFRNRARLHQASVDYPILGTREGKGIAHHKLSFSLLPAWPAHSLITPVEASVIWGELTAYIDGIGTDTMILSSEAFLNLPIESIAFVKELLSRHEVTPVCVLREPEDWRRSWIAHRIRQGHVVPAPKGPARDHAGPKLARWEDKFDVVKVPYSETVLDDVLAAMGLNPAELEPVQRRNESCSERVLDLLNRLNAIELCEANRAAIREVLFEEISVVPDLLGELSLNTIDRVTFNQRIIDDLSS